MLSEVTSTSPSPSPAESVLHSQMVGQVTGCGHRRWVQVLWTKSRPGDREQGPSPGDPASLPCSGRLSGGSCPSLLNLLNSHSRAVVSFGEKFAPPRPE